MNTQDWKNLAGKMNLKYKDKDTVYGYYEGYLISMGYSSNDENKHIFICLRYATENIQSSFSLESFNIYPEIKKKLHIDSGYITFKTSGNSFDGLFSYYLVDFVSDLNTILEVISEKGGKYKNLICEKCKAENVSEPLLVDMQPTLICSTCISQAREIALKKVMEYDSKIANYPRAVIFGLIAAVIGAFIWGGIAIAAGVIWSYVAILIGISIGFAMVKGAGKTDIVCKIVT